MRLLAFCLLLVACGDSSGSPDASSDAGSALDASAPIDASAPTDAGEDAGAEPEDGGVEDGGAEDGGGDASADAGEPIPCAFNRECPDTMFCDSEACEAGCFCAVGARGTGARGEACDSGNDCASSVCLEGPGDVLMCTVECVDERDCGGALPLCADVAFVGRICVRRPPA